LIEPFGSIKVKSASDGRSSPISALPLLHLGPSAGLLRPPANAVASQVLQIAILHSCQYAAGSKLKGNLQVISHYSADNYSLRIRSAKIN